LGDVFWPSTLGMTSLEKHWRYIWHYASYPYNGTATCYFGSKLNPGTSWREIVKQESIPNEEWTRVGIFLSVYLERETTEATIFHEGWTQWGILERICAFCLWLTVYWRERHTQLLISEINTTHISELTNIRKCNYAWVMQVYIMHVWMSCMYNACWQDCQDKWNWR
jgi:hypothetical protein